MADNVQWIRMKVGMFDGNSFKKIKRAKIGGVSYRDKLTAVWFELLDLAGKSNFNGYLVDNNEIPYRTFEDIAIMLDREEKEVELCMQFFINEKMVEIVDDIFCLTNFMQYQNQDGLEKIKAQNRERQARFREKKTLQLKQSRCQYCGDIPTGYDHIIPTAMGGSDNDNNKVLCCKECNRIKNTQPLSKFLNENRDRINDEIVTNNPIIMRYVTLSNVTNRYEDNVTSRSLSYSISNSNSLFNSNNDNFIENELKGNYTDKKMQRMVEVCEKWGIVINASSPLLADMDFDLIDKAFESSKHYLQDKTNVQVHTLSWIIANYHKLKIEGYYKDRPLKGKTDTDKAEVLTIEQMAEKLDIPLEKVEKARKCGWTENQIEQYLKEQALIKGVKL